MEILGSFHGLLDNLMVLMAMVFVYDIMVLDTEWDPNVKRLSTGLFLGVFGALVMLDPWELTPGLFFDTRSIVLAIGGLFFGTIPALIAGIMTTALRLAQGGVGTWAGILVIWTSVSLGVGYRHYKQRNPEETSGTELYILGFIVHLFMIVSMLTLPQNMRWDVVSRMSIPVIIINPLGFWAIGRLFQRRIHRKHAAKAWEESSNRYRQMFRNNLAVKLLIDPLNGQIRDANLAAAEFYGYDIPTLTRMKIMDINQLDDYEIRVQMKKASQEQTGRFHFRHKLSSGAIRDVEVISGPLEIGGEKLLYSTVFDTTERKLSEAIQSARLRLVEFASHRPSVRELLTHFLDEVEVLTNSTIGFYHFVDESAGELTLQAWSTHTISTMCNAEGEGAHYPIEDAGVWVDCIRVRKSVIHNDYQSLSHKRGMPEGHAQVIREIVVPVMRGDKIVAVLGVGNKPVDYEQKDIELVELLADMAWETVEKVVAQENMTRVEAQAKVILETSMDAFWLVDLEGRILEVNETAQQMLGYSAAELKNMVISQIDVNEDREKVRKHIQFCIEHGSDRFESVHRKKDGSLINVDISVKFHPFETGRLSVFCRDISERYTAIRQLQQQEYYLRKAQELGQIGTWELDILNNVLIWTDENCRIFGVEPGSVVNYEIFISKVHPDDREEVNHRWSEAVKGADYDIEHRLLVNGEVKWVREKADIEYDATGTAIRAIGFTQDLTTRKEEEQARQSLENQLRQSQKLEALGTMVGGISHELNNVLQSIFLYGEMVADQLPGDPVVKSSMEHLLKDAERARKIVKQVLTFSREEDARLTPQRIHSIVEEALTFERASLPPNITISQKIDSACAPILCDDTQIHQVVINLCNNAKDAMQGDGGTLSVRLEPSEDGHGVHLAIADTGMGMDDETLSKIFDPFFTTKAPGSGTGLGLSVIHGIVRTMGGRIEVTSQVGQGTQFNIFLPAADTESEIDRPAEGVKASTHRTRLLLVDDEESIRNAIQTVLTRKGYEVDVAPDGKQAFELVLKKGEAYDLVVSDVSMPGMSGLQLAQAIRAEAYRMPIILSTGRLDPEARDISNELENIGFIQKPWTANELIKVINEAKDGV